MELSSIYGQGSLQLLIDQYMALEERPRNELINKKGVLNDKKSVFSKLDSKLSALKTKMTYFNDVVFNPFFAKKTVSSDPDKLDLTAEGTAVAGNHSLTVERLAYSDTRVSDQFNSDDSGFGSFTADETFTISVGHPTDDNSENRVEISVTVTADQLSDTNANVLQNIADAIDTAMSTAVANEEIDSDEVIHASVVSEETGKSRLVLSSEQTGYTYRMEFGASSLLDFLNVNNNAQTSGTTGGYVTEVGTGATDSMLNAKFVMDGLTFYRDSNNVEDALTGVTLKLYDTFDTPEQVTIESDADQVREDVEDFISKYNEAIKFLREKTRTNPDTHERGALSGDSLYQNMIADLRNLVSASVTTTTSDDYTLLYHIGIEADQDGTLSIKDTDKFTRALEANALYVSDLFTSDDGIAHRLEDYIDGFVKTGGTIDDNKEQIDNQITSLNDRIKYMNELLDKKEKQYFEEFSKLQETMYILQNQQTFFSSFIG